MALTLSNIQVSEGVFLLRAQMPPIARTPKAGQFYMLLPPGDAFALRRPISIYDYEGGVASFAYQVKGRGTKALSRLAEGSEIDIYGPLGHGYEFEDKDSVFVAGGLGIAPMHYALKQFRRAYPHRLADCFLGFSTEPFLLEAFTEDASTVTAKQGGYITDEVPCIEGRAFFCCGPEAMMRALFLKLGEGSSLQVSLEKRMGCGVGACLSCSVPSREGNKRVCKEGPVFSAREVFF